MTGGHGPRPRRIVFWQPIESPHQRDFLEAVATAFAGEVVLAVEERLPAERVAQGWPAVVHDKVLVVNAADPAVFSQLVSFDTPDSLHVFSGFFSHRIVWQAFRRLAFTEARRAMLSEAPESRMPIGWLKRARGRFFVRRYGQRIELVMAMGTLGRRFMEDVGFPADRVLTFGYRLAIPSSPWPPAPARAPGLVRFVAAGQLIRRKGFDVLVDALATLPHHGWECDIFGDGPMRRTLVSRISRQTIAGRVRVRSTIPNSEVRREIAAADWTVVPSRHDGWGMVVNESLIAGTPVVCSDGCGAADLVDAVGGHVVPAGDRRALAEVLQKCVLAGRISADRRTSIHALASRHGVDELVAAFLARIDALA